MSLVSTLIMSFSMSADAFAVSVGKGVHTRPRFQEALRIGLLFGFVEATTPIVGWLAGMAASGFIQAIDHWIAFGILGLVGAKMFWESFQDKEEEPEPRSRSRRWGMMLLTAFGTSIDAMAVGVSLAVLDVKIWIPALAIGLTTAGMVTVGTMTGHYLGLKAGRIAEALGGVGLIAIGSSILLSHLGMI